MYACCFMISQLFILECKKLIFLILLLFALKRLNQIKRNLKYISGNCHKVIWYLRLISNCFVVWLGIKTQGIPLWFSRHLKISHSIHMILYIFFIHTNRQAHLACNNGNKNRSKSYKVQCATIWQIDSFEENG